MGRIPAIVMSMLVFAASALASNAGDPDYSAVGGEVVRIVRAHFLAAERAEAWADRHAVARLRTFPPSRP